MELPYTVAEYLIVSQELTMGKGSFLHMHSCLCSLCRNTRKFIPGSWWSSHWTWPQTAQRSSGLLVSIFAILLIYGEWAHLCLASQPDDLMHSYLQYEPITEVPLCTDLWDYGRATSGCGGISIALPCWEENCSKNFTYSTFRIKCYIFF